PGETKIETDRRRIRARVTKLRKDLARVSQGRDTTRQRRHRREVPSVAIAGYTNAGKSSVLNRLTGAGVLVEDALFATLDPTVRRARTQTGRVFTLSDTVGFVRHLPHQLVESFRSTLEEVADADLVLHVVDGSHPHPEGQISAVREVLGEIGAREVPEIVAVNKADLADPVVVGCLRRREPCGVVVSARTGEGVDELLASIEHALPHPARAVQALVPYDRGDLVARVYSEGEVRAEEHTPEGTRLDALVPPGLAARLEPYALTGVT
ncbi:MAG: GTPase HflX, partial [Streptosporangiaceae bacterium]